MTTSAVPVFKWSSIAPRKWSSVHVPLRNRGSVILFSSSLPSPSSPSSPSSPQPPSPNLSVKFRTGSQTDLRIIQKAVLDEKMNPLFLDPTNFTVATDDEGRVMGFGQLVTVGAVGEQQVVELRSLLVQPQYRGEGVGQALAAELIRQSLGRMCLTMTIDSKVDFYTSMGFTVVPASELTTLPWMIAFEWLAGNVVARAVAGQGVVVLKMISV